MDSNLVTGIMTIGFSIFTYVVGNILGKKKRDLEIKKKYAEIDTVNIQNLKSTIEIYKIVHDELSDQLKGLSTKCHDLAIEVHGLRNENISLKEEIHQLRDENKTLKTEITKLNQKLNNQAL